MLHAAVRSQEVNPAKLPLLFRKQFELCKIKPGETIAIVSDLGTRRDYIEAAFAAADDLGADIYEMCVNAIPGWTKVGVPTIGKCKGTLEALMACDMVLIFHVPLFSAWLRRSSRCFLAVIFSASRSRYEILPCASRTARPPT